MLITKRNNEQVEFDKQHIVNAINKAFIEVTNAPNDEVANEIANDIEYTIYHCGKNCSVEDIQDMVEDDLMCADCQNVARAYIRYRYKKEVARNIKSDFIDAIGEKLRASNVQNQNANVDEQSFGGRMGEATGVMTKDYALNYIVSDMARDNHLNNKIYIHDLDSYAVGMHNCLSIPFDDLLAKGFNTRQTDVRPAGSVNTAFQLVAVIFQLQSLQQFGGVSATHLDWTMVPYVRKSFYKHFLDGLKYLDGMTPVNAPKSVIETSIESPFYASDIYEEAYEYAMDMTKREIHQAVEGMYHNLK